MNDVLYYHGKTEQGQRYTIAGTYVDNVLQLGLSFCNPKDAFVKQIGRVKSSGRLRSKNSSKGVYTFGNVIMEQGSEIKYFIKTCQTFSRLTPRSFRKLFNLY